MTHHSADPDPSETPDLENGCSPRSGDTPPAESSTSDAGPQETYNPGKGWAKGPVLLIGLVAIAVLGFFIARLIAM